MIIILINPLIKGKYNVQRGTLIEAHISDIHFGALDPAYQYKILEEQFISQIDKIKVDLISINGDLFDHKFMSNSDVIMYAIKFISRLVDICKRDRATLILVSGTPLHDAGQYSLFYHYLEDPTVDVRIIENVKFEYVKGKKILCIPELYGRTAEYYNEFLLNSGLYDSVCMHGTLKGAIYGKNEEDIGAQREPVFSINNFVNCAGPIISGHNHVPGCYNSHFYYCGSPYRWKFGEEEEKGYLILLHNLDTREYYTHFEAIMSYRYNTVNLDDMLAGDPKYIIEYIKGLQSKGIENIRIEFTIDNEDTLNIVKNHYKNDSSVKIKSESKATQVLKASEEMLDKYKEYDYIFDRKLDEYEIMSRYINQNKGYKYISSEELMSFIKNEI